MENVKINALTFWLTENVQITALQDPSWTDKHVLHAQETVIHAATHQPTVRVVKTDFWLITEIVFPIVQPTQSKLKIIVWIVILLVMDVLEIHSPASTVSQETTTWMEDVLTTALKDTTLTMPWEHADHVMLTVKFAQDLEAAKSVKI